MTIHIHIDRVVLHGFDLERHGAETLRTAVGDELVRLFERPDATAGIRGEAVPVLQTSPVQFEQASPARMGSQIAGAVFGSVSR
jgi:hypothetical protein